MDPALGLEAKRLYISTALTMHATRSIRGFAPADSDEEKLLLLAHRLSVDAGAIERRHHICFDPPYPGVSAGVESVGKTLRLVFACQVLNTGREVLGVAFTTLIPGRRPQVSVAPGSASISGEWRLLDELS